MAMRHVKKYYKDISKMYFEMVDALVEQQEAFAAGKVEEAAVQGLMTQVEDLSRDYKMLSYMMWLWSIPNKENKRKHYEKQTHKQLEQFQYEGVTQEQQMTKVATELKTFKEDLKQITKGE